MKPTINSKGAHYLKGHASWLYCDECNKTVAYLCYVTYQYFKFDFICKCGNHGSVENNYEDANHLVFKKGMQMKKGKNARYCCEVDESPLFSPVLKNLESYQATIVCKACNTEYHIQE